MNPSKEWIFSLDWNDFVATPSFNVFQLFGVTITWDAMTWMVHVSLILIVLRFGRVDPERDSNLTA